MIARACKIRAHIRQTFSFSIHINKFYKTRHTPKAKKLYLADKEYILYLPEVCGLPVSKAINLEYLVGTSFAVRFQENPDLRA